MRRILFGLSVLLAAGALALGGGLPACIAKLEDHGGHLATFQGELENVVVLLVAKVAAPPGHSLEDFQKDNQQWVELITAQEERFGILREGLVEAYNTANPKRTARALSDLPGYDQAITKWQGKWHWLAEDGAQAHWRVKWLRCQIAWDKSHNLPMAAYMSRWFGQNTGTLDTILANADLCIRNRNQQYFNNCIKQAKECRPLIKCMADVHKNHKTEYEKFFRDFAPEKVGDVLPWFENWGVTQAEWPMFNELKVAWMAVLAGFIGEYTQSHRDVVKAWKPVLEEDFMRFRPFLKDYKLRELHGKYDAAILKLGREMNAAMKK